MFHHKTINSRSTAICIANPNINTSTIQKIMMLKIIVDIVPPPSPPNYKTDKHYMLHSLLSIYAVILSSRAAVKHLQFHRIQPHNELCKYYLDTKYIKSLCSAGFPNRVVHKMKTYLPLFISFATNLQ